MCHYGWTNMNYDREYLYRGFPRQAVGDRPFLVGAWFATNNYVGQACFDSNVDFNFWKCMGHALVGGLSGYFSTFGEPGNLGSNIISHAANAATSSALHNAIDERDGRAFWGRVSLSAGAGALEGFLTSEHFDILCTTGDYNRMIMRSGTS